MKTSHRFNRWVLALLCVAHSTIALAQVIEGTWIDPECDGNGCGCCAVDLALVSAQRVGGQLVIHADLHEPVAPPETWASFSPALRVFVNSDLDSSTGITNPIGGMACPTHTGVDWDMSFSGFNYTAASSASTCDGVLTTCNGLPVTGRIVAQIQDPPLPPPQGAVIAVSATPTSLSLCVPFRCLDAVGRPTTGIVDLVAVGSDSWNLLGDCAPDDPGMVLRSVDPSIANGPPGVPDGATGTPLTVDKLDPTGTTLQVEWDSSCGADGHRLLYGGGSTLTGSLGDPYDLLGAVCDIGGGPAYVWNGSHDPSTDPAGWIWMLVVADDGGSPATEGSWGLDGNDQERNGVGQSGSSSLCQATDKDLSNSCGQ